MSMDDDGKMADLTIEVLKDIRAEMRGMRGELVEVRDDMRGMRGELHEVRGVLHELRGDVQTLQIEMREVRGELHALNERVDSGFNAVNQRLDGVIEIVGTHHRGLESRVKRIEDHLGLPDEH
jgi:predicted nuclease with TOPRIM domain